MFVNVFYTARGFNKTCIKSEQCQQINLNSTCNVDRGKCECQQGFIQRIDTCIQGKLRLRQN